MRARFRFAAVLVLLLLAAGLLDRRAPAYAAAGGKITGTVKLEGTPPHQRPIDMSKEPSCAKVHTSPVTTENVVVGPNGELQNVVLYISEGLSASESSAVPSAVPELNQKGCQYVPHVLALDVNQHFKVVNSDQTSHNIHPLPKVGGANHEWNKSQPQGSAPFDLTWSAEEVAIPVKCNVHPWMHGYMVVVKGPYAVTDDKGDFSLENIPPGSYTVTAWQELYGTQTQKVTVTAGKPETVNFTFKTK
jgi:hypothetical protein